MNQSLKLFLKVVLWVLFFNVTTSSHLFLLGNEKSDSSGHESNSQSSDFEPYTVKLRDTNVSFRMVPIPGGEFLMGSPEGESDRKEDEGPQRKVKVEPFWMGACEVTWDEYDVWTEELDISLREITGRVPDESDRRADAVTRPTTAYMDHSGMGRSGFPVVSMTQAAAKMYCEWLSAKTGHYYRLPTEAEWEYACRAGTTTAYSFGDDVSKIDEYAWHLDNSEETYHKVGLKKPNSWGLYDMHGNVSEWVLDRYDPEFYSTLSADSVNVFPVNVPDGKEYPRVTRGGSWDHIEIECRSSSRIASHDEWKIHDPCLPKSIWYLTDGSMVGFRVVRPLTPPTEEQITELKLKTDIPTALQYRYERELKERAKSKK
jgi:formylglycine-generating enzyme required for sulfatase activity